MLKRLASLLTVRQQAMVAKGGKKQGKAAISGQKAPSASRGAATTSGAKKRGGRIADKLEGAATGEAEATDEKEDDPSKGPKRQSRRMAEPKEDAGGAGKRHKTRGGTDKGDTAGA